MAQNFSFFSPRVSFPGGPFPKNPLTRIFKGVWEFFSPKKINKSPIVSPFVFLKKASQKGEKFFGPKVKSDFERKPPHN